MTNVAEEAWKAFRRYTLPGLTVTESDGRIVFEQKDQTVKYKRLPYVVPVSVLLAIVSIFVYLAMMRNGWPFLVSSTPLFFSLFGLPLLAAYTFLPVRRLEIMKDVVVFTVGSEVRPIPVQYITGLDVASEQHGGSNEPTEHYGVIRIFDGPYAIRTLVVGGITNPVAVLQGVKAAIGVMNPSATENPNPALPGRQRAFAE